MRIWRRVKPPQRIAGFKKDGSLLEAGLYAMSLRMLFLMIKDEEKTREKGMLEGTLIG